MTILRAAVLAITALLLATPAAAQLDQILRGLGGVVPQQGGASDSQIASGLKEALHVGTENTVKLTGRPDGYFGNEAIKILMPESLRTLESGLRAVGYGPKVDEFILSMNRAAEKAAPFAKQIFWDAISAMSFDDARKIWSGGDTSATEYFRSKTSEKLAAAFHPIIERSTNEVGATRQYKELLGQAHGIPFLKVESLDLDQYVVAKGLDGLFHVLGQEEKQIRTNPAARTTELLKEVFGKK